MHLLPLLQSNLRYAIDVPAIAAGVANDAADNAGARTAVGGTKTITILASYCRLLSLSSTATTSCS